MNIKIPSGDVDTIHRDSMTGGAMIDLVPEDGKNQSIFVDNNYTITIRDEFIEGLDEPLSFVVIEQ